MSVSPRGLSIQSAYRQYRGEQLVVNRKYQRKLVWTVDEKANLIDSILRGYPIPLILLAEHKKEDGGTEYEIIDGIQRLNAIFDFIENKFKVKGSYFDVNEFTRAHQLAEERIFEPQQENLLPPQSCADFLDYELAVTIYPTTHDDEITEIFGRINSSGRQLSNQEKRQAGVINPFAEMIRQIASELRGDVSRDILLLAEMPTISIETVRGRQGYGVVAENTNWCRQGILTTGLLRESEDEQMLADIAVSILLDEPFASSRERLDILYDESSELYGEVQAKLVLYKAEHLAYEIRTTFSVLIDTIEQYDKEKNVLKRIVRSDTSGNPIKTEFYAVFMAFYRLVVQEEKSPDDPEGIAKALQNLQNRVVRSHHYTTSEDRHSNIATVYGLIEGYFTHREPPVIRHGPGLKIDFVNAIRRAKTETPRYEFKQGLLNLSPNNRELNRKLLAELVETMCGIANLGPKSDGYIFIGVADTDRDAKQVETLDGITALDIEGRYIVGIDRECRRLSYDLEQYVDLLLNEIRNSELSEPLKTQLLSQLDVVTYEQLSIIRITIPKQNRPSTIGEDLFLRDGSSTRKASASKAIAISQLF